MSNYCARCTRFLLLTLALGPAQFASAQSAADRFDPDANSTVSAVAVQADGKIVVGGADELEQKAAR